MQKLGFKILFTFIGISFFMSATELDIGEVHNTFFDEYDTYVKAEQVWLDNEPGAQQPMNTGLLSCFFKNIEAKKPQLFLFFELPENYFDYTIPKLFLRNSVWRI